MPTVAERACQEVVDEKMTDPEWVRLLSLTAAQLNQGKEYPQLYIEALFQKWRGSYTIYDALPFLEAHALIRSGRVQVFQIPVGVTPCRDRFVEQMDGLLGKLEYPFQARFWGGTQDEDGWVSVERPVNGLAFSECGELGFCIIPPRQYPLEVGYMNAYKLLIYLNGMGYLARWPYGHDRITIFTRYCVGSGETEFEALRTDVWGDFYTLPNPYADWWWKDGPPPAWPPEGTQLKLAF